MEKEIFDKLEDLNKSVDTIQTAYRNGLIKGEDWQIVINYLKEQAESLISSLKERILPKEEKKEEVEVKTEEKEGKEKVET